MTLEQLLNTARFCAWGCKPIGTQSWLPLNRALEILPQPRFMPPGYTRWTQCSTMPQGQRPVLGSYRGPTTRLARLAKMAILPFGGFDPENTWVP